MNDTLTYWKTEGSGLSGEKNESCYSLSDSVFCLNVCYRTTISKRHCRKWWQMAIRCISSVLSFLKIPKKQRKKL